MILNGGSSYSRTPNKSIPHDDLALRVLNQPTIFDYGLLNLALNVETLYAPRQGCTWVSRDSLLDL